MRLGLEKISTGVESENQIRLKKATARRPLAPLSKGRDWQRKILFVPVLFGAAPSCGGLLMRVMLWLLCGDFE